MQVVRSVSRKLWAMIRVHYPSDSRRPPELCCYVDRHLPSLDVVVEPQIRIPLKANMKLAVDERSKVGLPAQHYLVTIRTLASHCRLHRNT